MIRHGVEESCSESNESEIQKITEVMEMDESLEKHSLMVLLNPDDYNSWNFLKKHFEGVDDKLSFIEKQLELTQEALQVNPKSYSTWFHRFYFFSKLRNKKEQFLCKLFLEFDKRNFHCWNYCIRNNFDLGLDLDNPSSIIINRAQEKHLFIDPSDESLWRVREHPFPVLNIFEDSIEILFKVPFIGSVEINGKVLEATLFTKRIKTGFCEVNKIKINQKEMELTNFYDSEFIEHILHLDPNCIHALKNKVMYGNREEALERLLKIDRKRNYENLRPRKAYYITN